MCVSIGHITGKQWSWRVLSVIRFMKTSQRHKRQDINNNIHQIYARHLARNVDVLSSEVPQKMYALVTATPLEVVAVCIVWYIYHTTCHCALKWIACLKAAPQQSVNTWIEQRLCQLWTTKLRTNMSPVQYDLHRSVLVSTISKHTLQLDEVSHRMSLGDGVRIALQSYLFKIRPFKTHLCVTSIYQ